MKERYNYLKNGYILMTKIAEICGIVKTIQKLLKQIVLSLILDVSLLNLNKNKSLNILFENICIGILKKWGGGVIRIYLIHWSSNLGFIVSIFVSKRLCQKKGMKIVLKCM